MTLSNFIHRHRAVGLVFSEDDTAKLRKILTEEPETESKLLIRTALPWLGLVGLLLVLAIAVALVLPSSATAQEAGDLIGDWKGVADIDGRNVPVNLSVTAVELGEDSGKMAWRTPKDCGMQTIFAGDREGRFVLNISSTDAPWCDLYSRGSLMLEIDADRVQSLTFELLDERGGAPVAGNLDRD